MSILTLTVLATVEEDEIVLRRGDQVALDGERLVFLRQPRAVPPPSAQPQPPPPLPPLPLPSEPSLEVRMLRLLSESDTCSMRMLGARLDPSYDDLRAAALRLMGDGRVSNVSETRQWHLRITGAGRAWLAAREETIS